MTPRNLILFCVIGACMWAAGFGVWTHNPWWVGLSLALIYAAKCCLEITRPWRRI